MNALYRPGPMEYIPSFIRRKHGEEPIEYDHPMMEPYLKDTYGITVYQEQVMLQSRALGLFTRGQSDTLRKAMGKKKFELLAELKGKFVEGCKTIPILSREPKKKEKMSKNWSTKSGETGRLSLLMPSTNRIPFVTPTSLIKPVS